MTSDIFTDWLLEFGDYISQFRERRVALVIDNASCHKKCTEQTKFRNIEIVYLPPNTTSLTQPMDAGVIASMRRRFKRKQVSQALKVIEENENNKYRIDLYTACTWLSKIWDGLEC